MKQDGKRRFSGAGFALTILVVRTRPLCPYPKAARYSGDGSIDDASNFRCVEP